MSEVLLDSQIAGRCPASLVRSKLIALALGMVFAFSYERGTPVHVCTFRNLNRVLTRGTQGYLAHKVRGF